MVLRADDAAVTLGASEELRGAAAVAERFLARSRGAQPTLVDGVAGLVWAPGGQPRVVMDFTISGGRIASIDLIADSEHIREIDLTIRG